MIYLIYGDDDVGVEEELAAMKGAAAPDGLGDINVTTLDAKGDARALTPDELTAAAFTMPFMAERRLVIVKRLLSKFEPRAPSRSGASGREDVGSTIVACSSVLCYICATVRGGPAHPSPGSRRECCADSTQTTQAQSKSHG